MTTENNTQYNDSQKIKDANDKLLFDDFVIQIQKEIENVIFDESGSFPQTVGVFITQLKNLVNSKLKTINVDKVTISVGKELYVTFLISNKTKIETFRISLSVQNSTVQTYN